MIIVDTGVWVALADARDRRHADCREFMRRPGDALITTYPVLVETTHLLLTRTDSRKMLALLTALHDQNVGIFSLQQSHLPRLLQLMRQYADLPMDLADASLVLLAEELGHGRIASTDERDFHAYRWKNRHPFQNLLANRAS